MGSSTSFIHRPAAVLRQLAMRLAATNGHTPSPVTASDGAGAAGHGPRQPVLELRIHGVNNTAPDELLDLPSGGAEQVAGDNLGSFWRPTEESQKRLRPGQRGYVPEGVIREAYSWGGMARTTPATGATGTAGIVLNALARLGWALLLPFGLVNVAFWSRRLDTERGQVSGWQAGPTAALIQVFALCLTLLMLSGVAVVSLDLVATQCFAENQRWCPALPAAFDPLASWSHPERLAAMSVVPVAALALVMALSTITRVRYEHYAAVPPVRGVASAARRPDDGPAQAAHLPALATAGFWSNARVTSTVGWLHVAAGLFAVVLITAAHQVFGVGPDCVAMAGNRPVDCLRQVSGLPGSGYPFAVTAALGLLGVLVAAAMVFASARGAGGASRRRAAGVRVVPALAVRVKALVAASVLLYVVQIGLLIGTDHETPVDVPLLGLTMITWCLTCLMLAIAGMAITWRVRSPRARAADYASHREEAWWGTAPAVFLLLALGSALTLTSWLVLGTGNWLNGGAGAGALLRDGLGRPGSVGACVDGCPDDPDLMVPAVFVWFGAAVLVAAVVLLLVAVGAYVLTSPSLSAAGDEEDPAAQANPALLGALRARRRMAAAAHRAEPALGLVALTTLVATTLALGWTVRTAYDRSAQPPRMAREPVIGVGDVVYQGVVDGAAWALAACALLAMGGLAGGAALGRHRPLGLVWDLMCFLPRAGHPFGPPCYAERVVPELVRRYVSEKEAGRIVVSAHSLGAVLAAASILALRGTEDRDHLRRIHLVTHGCQIRVYFGRMFPELLGPDVTGTTPCHGAALLRRDPWRTMLRLDADPRPARPRTSSTGIVPEERLTALLTHDGALCWVNLWRRTDYLGFPVDRFRNSIVDLPADEVDRSGYLPVLGTHGGYTRTRTYDAVLATLADGWPGTGEPTLMEAARERSRLVRAGASD